MPLLCYTLRMINISNSKHLDIILPNTNKALAEVLKNASPKELATIVQGKDLKSVLSTILQQSANNPSMDKELLQLVKNNPTLKNLGDVSATIKDLLSAIKSDKTPLPIEKILTSFLTDIKDLKNSELKQKIENSGVFLESKLKDVKNPLVELKSTLESLLKELKSRDTASNKTIPKQIQELLNSDILKKATPSVLKDLPSTPIKQIASEVQALINKLQVSIKNADTIHSPVIQKALDKLQHLLDPKILTPNATKETLELKNIPAENLKSSSNKELIDLKTLSAENFKLSSIKEPLEQISMQMQKSFTLESKGILGALEKIFAVLKTIEQSALTPKASLEQFIAKNVPQEINKLSDSIKSVIQKSDPLFKHETTLLLNKLEHLNTPQKLAPNHNVQEILNKDLKAVLLQTADEIQSSNNPKQTEILKHIDKLSLQIDHYQLLSHLSNSSSLYLPFSWDMLEEGNIEMRKAEDEKFYCDIDLKLKEYGELNIKMTLYEKNQLNLHIYSCNEEFKTIIKDNIASLRSALIETRITPREIRIFEPKQKVSPYGMVDDDLKMGFEVKA
jgi:hypothetical protein